MQASFTQQPIWKQLKQAKTQVISSQGPAGGMQAMKPLDELATSELDEATDPLDALDAFDALADDELPL